MAVSSSGSSSGSPGVSIGVSSLIFRLSIPTVVVSTQQTQAQTCVFYAFIESGTTGYTTVPPYGPRYRARQVGPGGHRMALVRGALRLGPEPSTVVLVRSPVRRAPWCETVAGTRHKSQAGTLAQVRRASPWGKRRAVPRNDGCDRGMLIRPVASTATTATTATSGFSPTWDTPGPISQMLP